MSLKALHIVFVVVSTLLSFGVAGWCYVQYAAAGGGGYLFSAVLCFLFGVALIVYGVWFLRKLRNVSYL